MKFIVLFSAFAALTACAMKTVSLPELIEKGDVDTFVKQAKQTGEYKVLIAPYRNPTAPGISQDEMEMLKEKCGAIYLPGVTDARTKENAEGIKKAIAFAREYNPQILELCKKG